MEISFRINTFQYLPLMTLIFIAWSAFADTSTHEVRACASFHAFEHLGGYSEQAEAAAACGATVIYATGMGGMGYSGIPAPEQWQTQWDRSLAYNQHSRQLGIEVIVGYLCATSIVGLDAFDDHWPEELKAALKTPPAEWLQQDKDGKPLPSWYGGEYKPACMNNPDWRTYQKFMVSAQINTGHDGIFFDNPTVHTDGCYCSYCMAGFVKFMKGEGRLVADTSTAAMRRMAQEYVKDFKRYRCTIARDFFAEMRAHARSLNPNAVVTANNSLNQQDVLFSQCHLYAYNIQEMSKTEDWVVIEDMSAQPRIMPDGKLMECAPTYAQLQAIIHDKPLVAVTVAEGDYHTPPNLVRLAMCEAAAHKTGYMVWSTWPEEQRARMIAAISPCADWLRTHAELINASTPRQDVLVFFPFRNWVNTKDCAVTKIAQTLTAANGQYAVVSEENLSATLNTAKVVLLEDRKVCTQEETALLSAYEQNGGTCITATDKDWLKQVQQATQGGSLQLDAPETVRAVVRDTKDKTIVFLYNLNMERLSSFEDKVTPVPASSMKILLPRSGITSVTLSSPDASVSTSALEYQAAPADNTVWVECKLPEFETALLIELK